MSMHQRFDGTPLIEQVGGDHYKIQAIQPIEYILANKLGYCEANVVKYVTRHKSKGGLQDLLKAKHYIDMLIAHEYSEVTANVDSEK